MPHAFPRLISDASAHIIDIIHLQFIRATTMPIVSPDSFENGLKNNRIVPIYLLFGEEDLLIEEALDRLLAAVVDEETRDFNYDQFKGDEIQLRDVVDRASSYPMMAERRVVVVRDIDKAIGGRKGDDVNGFADYLANPSETTVLVMTVNGATPQAKGSGALKAPYKSIGDNGLAVSYKKLYDRDIPSWVNNRIAKRGATIAPEALDLFIGYVGGTLRALINEIEKLFIYLGDRTSITAEDVGSVIGASKNWNVFELQKALGEKKLDRSIEIAERMIRAGEPLQLTVTMLTRYFTILWRLLELRARSKDQTTMAREVGVAPFFIGEYLSATSRFGLPGVRNAFAALLSTDLALKTSRADHEVLASLLLMSIVEGVNHFD